MVQRMEKSWLGGYSEDGQMGMTGVTGNGEAAMANHTKCSYSSSRLSLNRRIRCVSHVTTACSR